MTAPAVLPSFATQMKAHYERLRGRRAARDRNMEILHQVREGHIRQLFPDELNFSLSFEGSPIANFVDIVAHDMAEGIAPLPALACVSGKMVSQADQKRAEIKNRIGDNYWRESNLEIQMMTGADRYVSYGFLPLYVEADPSCKLPYIHVEDPRFAYYELDRYGNCTVYAYRRRKTVDELCALFPEVASIIRRDKDGREVPSDHELELVRWVDKTHVTMFMPEREGLILDRYPHKLKRTPAWIAQRPGESDTPRGQFDDVIWVQVARSIMSTLALEAASIAVQSPIAAPADMEEFPIGPHAILTSDDSDKIHKVPLELPTAIFAENANLDNELRVGARYPEARSGNPGTSVITGKGVQQLLGTFDSQTRGAQIILKRAFEKITEICFEMDEAWWPHESKTVNGTTSGTSYEFDYTPAEAIAGRYACTVTYGFAAGLAPEQSIITMLQLEGAGLLAKGTTMENLPFPIDQVQEMKKINIEGSREALKQGLFSLVQSTGQLAAAGQDPMPIIKLVVDVIQSLEQGQTVEDATAAAYQAMQQAQQAAQQQQQQMQQQAEEQAEGDQGGGAAGDMTGQGSDMRPTGVAEGQAGLPPGGRPTLEQMITGFRGGGNVPVMQNEVRRSVPLGTQ